MAGSRRASTIIRDRAALTRISILPARINQLALSPVGRLCAACRFDHAYGLMRPHGNLPRHIVFVNFVRYDHVCMADPKVRMKKRLMRGISRRHFVEYAAGAAGALAMPHLS